MASRRTFRLWLLVSVTFLLCTSAASAVTIDWVSGGDAGNSCETQSQGCFGAVADAYRIGKYEVSNAEYTEFLNAVADTDANALYNTSMGSGFGGITRSGSSGSYSYSTIAGREDLPVNWVSLYDSLRFANWLHNGQPTGAQDSTTTEDGAYDMSLGSSVVRKAGATAFLPSEDEWYKAAYYKGGGTSAGYWDYPAGSDTQTTCASAGATANTANCDNVVADLTDIGSYTGSPSPYGTFDQGGNVWEWNEAVISGSQRGDRGASFRRTPGTLAASARGVADIDDELDGIGFRVASPVPPFQEGFPSLGPVGLLLVAAGLLGAFGYHRRRL